MAHHRLGPSTTLVELMQHFPTEAACRTALEELRWPEDIRCPHCNSVKIYRTKREQFFCDTCSYQFSVTSGTIFHDTHLPLQKWFITIWLIAHSKKGMSENQIKRTIGVSY